MYYNDLLPVDHPECARDCMEVVRILMRQPKTEGNFRLMDAALARAREAHSLSPTTNEDRQDRIDACSLLAVSLERRADYEDNVSLLDQVISLQREALALCPAGQMHTTLYNRLLAGSLKRMHKRTGEDHSLEEAILLEREALSFCPSEHPEHPGACGDLASSLIVRYEKSGSDHLLQEAIGLQREALSICLLDNPYRPWGCGSLAGSLAMRYDRTGDDRLLDEAIELQREALVLCEVEHPYRAASCGNLADSLVSRYKQNEDDSLLEEAIFLLREGLALRPEGHPRRALACGNLANALKTRYQRTHDDRLLDEVINLEREALALGPEARSDRAMFLSNLTASLVLRLVRTRDITLFTEIYTLEQEGIAIASPPARWRNLCKLSWVHFTPTSPFYDVEKAISYLSQSFDDRFDNMSQALGEIAACIGRIWDLDAENKYTRLTSIYERTIKLLPLLSHSELELHPKLNALREFSQIGSDAFVSAALAGDPTLGLEILELARGVIWSQSLYLRDPQLQDVPEPFQTELKELLHEVMTRSVKNERPSAFTSRDLLHDQSSRANSFVREIREMQGLDRFMLGETFETLRTVASHHPVVVLVGARRHFYALILTALHYKILSLELSDEDLRSLSFTLGSARLQRSVEQPGDALPEIERLGLKKVTPSGTVAPLDLQLRTLWRKVVSPILEQLGLKSPRHVERPRLYWCPTGIFSTLPLHAAGIDDGPNKVSCADFVVSSYTPTITALIRAQRAARPLNRADLALALVAEKRAQDSVLQVIHGVDNEIMHVVAAAKTNDACVIHQQIGSTTVAGTAEVMQKANIVHLACHGIQDINDATQSGFCLGDGRLTISKLMDLKLDRAFLAFLSACETAKGDKEQPDQVMHLAAAMLFSGFNSVIATMWAIADDDGPKVAKWFYEELLTKEVVDADSVAYALDFAVGKLRQSGVAPHRWAPFIHMGA